MAHKLSVLGIDIAKQVFHVVGMDDTGHVVLRKRIARSGLLPFRGDRRDGAMRCNEARNILKKLIL
jgi:hypothetical protein